MTNPLRIAILIAKIASYCLGLLLIYWLLLKISGHSPTSDQIILAYLGALTTSIFAIVGVLIKIVGDVRELKGEFKQFVKSYDSQFARKK